MSSSVFTQVASGGYASRAELVFRAALVAFCALSRPSRAEIAQIDDLTQSLLPMVSVPCRRFAAAALSDCAHAPAGLVNRLCDDEIEVAAPLLARSPLLDTSALIGLLRRHGSAHARVIARRPDLNPVVADLIQALFRQEQVIAETERDQPDRDEGAASGEAAENARRRLRGMMRGAPEPALPAKGDAQTAYPHLRDTALLDHQPFFRTALADALGIDMGQAGRTAADAAALLPALHGLGLCAEQAFLIVAAALPEAVEGKAAIRALLDAFAEFDARAGETTEPDRQLPPARGESPPARLQVLRRA